MAVVSHCFSGQSPLFVAGIRRFLPQIYAVDGFVGKDLAVTGGNSIKLPQTAWQRATPTYAAMQQALRRAVLEV
ncbi:MAG: hypothetical protein AAGD23_05325 [Pseudomonadota bacterium]